MKPIRIPAAAPQITPAVPSPLPVPVTQFAPPAPVSAQAAFEDGPVPPMPAHIGQPVGPPPAVVDLPSDYEGYIELAKKVSRGQMTDKAILWATLAQAEAQKEIADRLGHLLEYLGAGDGDPEVPGDEQRLAEEIATALLMVKEQIVAEVKALIPPGFIEEMKHEIAKRAGLVEKT